VDVESRGRNDTRNLRNPVTASARADMSPLFERRRLVAPCYHIVSDAERPHVKHLYPFRDVRRFAQEVDFLLRRFKPVSLAEVTNWARGRAVLPRNAFHLSFDDGFREMSEIVAAVCRGKGVPVTFFLTTRFLDNKLLGFRHKASLLLQAFTSLSETRALSIVEEASRGRDLRCDQGLRNFVLSVRHKDSPVLDEMARLLGLDFESYLRVERPYLTCDQVRKLLRDGFSIGAHSLDHPRYAELDLEQQIQQTSGSIEFLEQNFGVKERAFAFPFVSDGVSETFFHSVFSRQICDVVFCIGGIPAKHQWPLVQRFGVERATDEPLSVILRNMNRTRWRQRIGRALAPLRQLLQ
jgi:peptidoglycan/xylan/chitin deacetylase (PgdA/CDA1 family)